MRDMASPGPYLPSRIAAVTADATLTAPTMKICPLRASQLRCGTNTWSPDCTGDPCNTVPGPSADTITRPSRTSWIFFWLPTDVTPPASEISSPTVIVASAG